MELAKLKGNIFKTTDGGVTWNTGFTGTRHAFNSLFFTGTDVGYLAGDKGAILKTDNGGAVEIVEPSSRLSRFFIYPNPAASRITIGLRDRLPEGAAITVYGLAGRKMVCQPVSSSLGEIDISGWPKGVYIVSLHDNRGGVDSQILLVR